MPAAPTELAIHKRDARRMGFFTDTTTCIGCKACEVACKQWNDLPADGQRSGKGWSYDYTGALSASTWRHVRFVETAKPAAAPGPRAEEVPDLDLVALASPGGTRARTEPGQDLPGLDLVGWAGDLQASARLGEHGGASNAGDGAMLDRW